MVRRRTVARVGALMLVLNIAIATLSFLDLLVLGTGAIRVDLPRPADVRWSADPIGQSLLFRTSYTVANRGPYAITDLRIHSILLTETGFPLVEYRDEGLSVAAWTTRTFSPVAAMPFDRMVAADLPHLLLRDTHFTLRVAIDADTVFGLVHFRSRAAVDQPWRSPLGPAAGLLINGTLQQLVAAAAGPEGPALAQTALARIISAFLAPGVPVIQELPGDLLATYLVTPLAQGGADLAIRLVSGSPPRTLVDLHVPIATGLPSSWAGEGGGIGVEGG